MPNAMDPIERHLRALADGGSRVAQRLPADEVRARGRRYRRGVAAVSALTALAIIGSGAVAFGAAQSILGGGGDRAASEPLRAGGWLQQIPANFVIDADPPLDDSGTPTQGPDETLGIVDAPICGEQGIDGSPEPVDQLGFRTASQWRGLLLFASDVDAKAGYHEFISRADACPTGADSRDNGLTSNSTWAFPVFVEIGYFAESGYVVITQTLPSEAVVFYHLGLQGNAVAVVRTDTLLSPGTSVANSVLTASERGARATVELARQQCVFSSNGCGVTAPVPLSQSLYVDAEEFYDGGREEIGKWEKRPERQDR